jgi:hypothetical protein
MTPEPAITFEAPALRGADEKTVCAATARFFDGISGDGDLAAGIDIRLRDGTRLLCVIDAVSEAGVPRVRLQLLPDPSSTPGSGP